jgi:MoxR-like ATPase
MLRISLGYPDPSIERDILTGNSGRAALARVKQILSQQSLLEIQQHVENIKVSDTLLDYVQRLIAQTRQDNLCHLGLSPRGAISLVKSAKSWALIQGRDHVLPEDVQAVFVATVGHRIIGKTETQGDQLARHILNVVDTVGSGVAAVA